MTTDGAGGPASHGSVAEEIAALAEALRARGRDGGGAQRAGGEDEPPGAGAGGEEEYRHRPGTDACEICPVCRAIAALHTVSPSAVASLADLAHQAELTLRALAVDLRAREADTGAPAREDIPVEDLGDDTGDDVGDE